MFVTPVLIFSHYQRPTSPPSKKPPIIITTEQKVQPKLRSMSFVLQGHPVGIGELLKAQPQKSIVRSTARLRSTNQRGRQFEPAKGKRGSGPNASIFHIGYPISASLPWAGLDFEPIETGDKLDFGQVLSNDAVPSRIGEIFARATGPVNVTLTGSKAFSISSIQVHEYVSGDSYGSSYEKIVGYLKGPVQADSGAEIDVVIEFDPKAIGAQNGLLSIDDGQRVVNFPLTGQGTAKQLSVKASQVSLQPTAIEPGEEVDATISVDVQQNSGSQLGFEIPNLPQGVKYEGDTIWVSKPGVSSHKLRIFTDANAKDNPATCCTVNVYRVDTHQVLATVPLKFAVKREWIEWSYTRSAGKQDIHGTLLLANTGEFVWEVQAHNSSLVFPDTFFTAICFPGIGVNGTSPTLFLPSSLPIAGCDTLFFEFTGQMPITSFANMKTTQLESYLAIDEGGPVAGLVKAANGVTDLFQSAYDMYTNSDSLASVTNTYGGKVAMWLKDHKSKFVQIKSAKCWQ